MGAVQHIIDDDKNYRYVCMYIFTLNKYVCRYMLRDRYINILKSHR
jgi:hypothetical protein